MSRFFIFALPRSRTAWVANLLCWSTSFCHHEVSISCDSMEDLVAEMDQFPPDFTVGNCDSANLIIADNLFGQYPDAKLVYLERSEAAVRKSMHAIDPEMGDAIPQLRELARYAKEQVIKRGGMVFDVDAWQPHDTHALWQYLIPHIPYPKQRNDQLEWMRVTITEDRWDYLKARAKEMSA
jgi:hypothetical protein